MNVGSAFSENRYEPWDEEQCEKNIEQPDEMKKWKSWGYTFPVSENTPFKKCKYLSEKWPGGERTKCAIFSHWKFLDKIGQGTFGSVYIACKHVEEKICNSVAKFIRIQGPEDVKRFHKEVKISVEMGKRGIGPIIHDSAICYLPSSKGERMWGVIIMERMDGTFTHLIQTLQMRELPFLVEKVIALIKQMNHYGVFHRDMSTNNVLYKGAGKDRILRISDFGLALEGKEKIPIEANWTGEPVPSTIRENPLYDQETFRKSFKEELKEMSIAKALG